MFVVYKYLLMNFFYSSYSSAKVLLFLFTFCLEGKRLIFMRSNVMSII